MWGTVLYGATMAFATDSDIACLLLYGMYSLQAESFVIGHGDKHALGFNAACVLALYTSSSKFLGSIIQPITIHLDLDRVLRQIVASWGQAQSKAKHV